MTTPLSDAQKRLWFTSQLEGSSAYNIPVVLRLAGRLDRAALVQAVVDVVGRHDVLRTVYPLLDDEPHQLVLAPSQLAELTVLGECDPAEVPEVVAAHTRYAFDLGAEPPLRSWLLRTGAEQHLFVLVLHHIATDGWSIGPLLRDLGTAYRARLTGEQPLWPQLSVDYTDYALWHRELLGDAADEQSLMSRQTAFWREALAGLPEELVLPRDRPRTAEPSHEGGVVVRHLDPQLHGALSALARHNDVTLFMVLQAAFATLLSRLGAGNDIPLGTPVAGRTDEALDELIGFFVNTLVLRTDLTGNPTFTELLTRTRNTDLSAYAHQDLPFERLVEALNPPRSTTRHPLFQVMVVLQNNAQSELDLPGIEVGKEIVGNGAAKFDLTLAFDEEAGNDGRSSGLVAALEYATDLFDRETAESILTRLARVLAAVAAAPDAPIASIELLDPDERRRLIHGVNDTAAPIPHLLITDAFAEQVAARPAATALVCGEQQISYAELDARANRLAHHLSELVDAPTGPVSICLGRGIDLVVSLLAVLKTGAAFSILDPDFPAARLQAIVTESGSTLLITDREHRSSVDGCTAQLVCLDESAPAVALRDPAWVAAEAASPDDPACVMFTSGSTGRPKGVLAPHRALVATLLAQSYVEFGGETILQCSPVSWDAFALELFGALLAGSTCVLQPGQRPEPAVIAELIRRHRVTTLHLSASLLNFMLDEYPGVFAGVRQLMTGGEPASMAHVAMALRDYPDLRLVNGYSPVENMIFTLCHVIATADLARPSIPVGRPIANKQVYVLDEHLDLVPPGVAGELYMSGAGLALGYLNQPGPTAERFVANPFGVPGDRMYRTGDLVRWLPDGVLEFLGRVDAQIKIRGFRVEPSEVEGCLGRHPGVLKTAVLAREDRPGDKRLVAYVVGRAGHSPSTVALREHVAGALPAHLVPSAFVLLDRLPLTANGKLDRQALPVPDYAVTAEGRRPRDQREQLLCEVFEEVLGIAQVGIDDDFFDLGGHSLLATKLISRVRSRLGLELRIKAVFDHPSVAGLAGWLDSAQQARPSLLSVRQKRMSETS